VNCDDNQELCLSQHIRAFPTILLFKDGNIHPIDSYHGDRSTSAFMKYIEDKVKKEKSSWQSLDAGKRKRDLDALDREIADAKGEEHVMGGEGCMLQGSLVVKRVPGSLKLRLDPEGYSTDPERINATHIINKLSFTESKEESAVAGLGFEHLGKKLDGKQFMAAHTNHTFVHYLKLVKSSFLVQDEPKGGLYRYVSHTGEYQDEEELQSVMFAYEISPMAIVQSKASKPFYHFLTNVCAILGGVFSVLGMIDHLALYPLVCYIHRRSSNSALADL